MRRFSRNTPCGCGSGKKFKKCCGPNYNEVRKNKITRGMKFRSLARSPYLSGQKRKGLLEELIEEEKRLDSEENQGIMEES